MTIAHAQPLPCVSGAEQIRAARFVLPMLLGSLPPPAMCIAKITVRPEDCRWQSIQKRIRGYISSSAQRLLAAGAWRLLLPYWAGLRTWECSRSSWASPPCALVRNAPTPRGRRLFMPRGKRRPACRDGGLAQALPELASGILHTFHHVSKRVPASRKRQELAAIAATSRR